MSFGKCRIGQVEGKIECFDLNEAYQIVAVKNEPPENYSFQCISSCSTEKVFVDHKYDEHEHNEEKLVANNLILKDLGHSKIFDNTITCDPVEVKIEDVDIFYDDIKRETVEEKSSDRFCKVCYQNFGLESHVLNSRSSGSECCCQKPNESQFYNIQGQDMTHDEKPFSLDLTLDSRLKSLAVQDEMITEGEGAKEDSSAIAHRRSVPPLEINKMINKMKCKFSSKPHENNLSVSKKKYQCKSCSKYFSHRSSLKLHERVHTGEKPFHCKICSKYFSHKGNLRIHERVHTGEKPFLCKICSKSFNQKSTLSRHERRHTGEKPFHCIICSKYFKEMINLRIHERIHTGETPFSCKVCSESFNRKNHLRIHERIHTGEQPFHCKICSKPFNQKDHLRNHERIHTCEKPHHCKICSKSFNQKSHLSRHERRHTGEKPFHCKICSKSFSQMGHLRIHERSHTGEKPFSCNSCSKSFNQKSTLNRHERIHTGEKPFSCKIF